MLLNITLGTAIAILLIFTTMCLFERIKASTTTTTTAAPAPPAAPKAKDQRPLWAQVPMVEVVPPRCTDWENNRASLDARFERQAQAGKDRPLPRFVPSPELPPQRKFHRPLKAKSRNWA
jgi:hypothetical protein